MGLMDSGGYDPIFEARPENLAVQAKFDASPAEASRAYGIRWVLVANADYYKKEWEYWWAVTKNNWCFDFSDSDWPAYREKFLPAAKLRVRREEVSLYELPDASPLAFDSGESASAAADRVSWLGAEVEVPGTGQRSVVVNIVVRPWLRAAMRTAAAGILGRRVGTHGGPRARRRNVTFRFSTICLGGGEFSPPWAWQRRRLPAWS